MKDYQSFLESKSLIFQAEGLDLNINHDNFLIILPYF
jgi:hypothetical protein